MLYYLTNTKPFINHPWACVIGKDLFKRRIENGIKEHGYPVVVDYLDPRNRSDYMYLEAKEVLHNFILHERYKIVYSRGNYRIYIRSD